MTASREFTVRAHAKINIILRILAREASGYHGIETLFQRLALHDVVTVHAGVTDRMLRCDGVAMPDDGLGPMQENLAWRAAELYAREATWDGGWDIVIDKQIPVGGGLGGGSADAAAVLRAMDSMSPAPVGVDRLVEMGGALGADVPFLVRDVSRAWAWGRGDRMMVLPPLPVVPVALCTFRHGVNTGEAYRAFASWRETRGIPIHATSYPSGAFDDWQSLAHRAVNDFELVVPQLHAGVAQVLPSLKALAAARTDSLALMSGSGATCFLINPPGIVALRSASSSVLMTETT